MSQWPILLAVAAFAAVLAAGEARTLSDAGHRITLAQIEAVK